MVSKITVPGAVRSNPARKKICSTRQHFLTDLISALTRRCANKVRLSVKSRHAETTGRNCKVLNFYEETLESFRGRNKLRPCLSNRVQASSRKPKDSLTRKTVQERNVYTYIKRTQRRVKTLPGRALHRLPLGRRKRGFLL